MDDFAVQADRWGMTDGRRAATFLTMPGEIRNKIYRLLFRQSRLIGESDQMRLSAKFLRTCRQVNTEAMSLLYGENTFKFIISNAAGPYYVAFCYPSPLSHENGPWYPPKTPCRALLQMRRFNIVVEYSDCHKITPIREAVRLLASGLQRVHIIDSPELDCKLDSMDMCDGNYRDPCWDSYNDDYADEGQVPLLLKTWLGRLRNVRTAVVEGLPQTDTEYLEGRWVSSAPLAKAPLPDMYEVLEKHALGIGFCEGDLREALLACESDDMESFKEYRAAILEKMRQHWECVQSEVMLRDPEHNDGDVEL